MNFIPSSISSKLVQKQSDYSTSIEHNHKQEQQPTQSNQANHTTSAYSLDLSKGAIEYLNSVGYEPIVTHNEDALTYTKDLQIITKEDELYKIY